MWKIRIIRNKLKSKVNQFKFETPTSPQLEQQTIEIESFFNIENDPHLYSLLLKWALDNNINSRKSYEKYRNTNSTITFDGRTFSLPNLAALSTGTTYKFYRDAIQPQIDNTLTKEILFQILDYYFKNNNIELNHNTYSKFIKDNARSASIIDPDSGKRKNSTAILFNGILYSIPNEISRSTPSGNRKFDPEAVSWLREYRRIQQNIVGNSDESFKYLWETDENTLRNIIEQLIKQLVEAELKITINNLNFFANKYLPKIEHNVNGIISYIPFFEYNQEKYFIYQINKRILDIFENKKLNFSDIWKKESQGKNSKTWGAEQYLNKNLATFKKLYPQYIFRVEAPLKELDEGFIPWINKFQTDSINKKFNREVLFRFLQEEFQGQPFNLSTIKNADSFQFIPQEDGKWTILVTKKLKTRESTIEIPNQIFNNVQPGKFSLDFVVYENNTPIAIYEFDGGFHYGDGKYAKTDLMSDVINDQIQKFYIENFTNIPYYRVPYFLVNGGTEKFPDFVINHMKEKLQLKYPADNTRQTAAYKINISFKK